MVELPYILQWVALPLNIVSSHESSGPPSNTWFPEPTRAHNQNGISIGSAVFAGLTTVADRPTDNATRSVTIGSICIRSTAMRPNNNKLSSYSLYSLKPDTHYPYIRPVHTDHIYGCKNATVYMGRIYGPYLRVVRIGLKSNFNCSFVLSFVGSQGIARDFYLGVQNIPCTFHRNSSIKPWQSRGGDTHYTRTFSVDF